MANPGGLARRMRSHPDRSRSLCRCWGTFQPRHHRSGMSYPQMAAQSQQVQFRALTAAQICRMDMRLAIYDLWGHAFQTSGHVPLPSRAGGGGSDFLWARRCFSTLHASSSFNSSPPSRSHSLDPAPDDVIFAVQANSLLDQHLAHARSGLRQSSRPRISYSAPPSPKTSNAFAAIA